MVLIPHVLISYIFLAKNAWKGIFRHLRSPKFRGGGDRVGEGDESAGEGDEGRGR